jgi:malonyl-CoA/methylmalonyl-CoA synthetase
LIDNAQRFADRVAIADEDGDHRYRELLRASERVASKLLAGRADLDGNRVAFLLPPTFAYPAVQWGIWRAGGIAVPLSTLAPAPELRYLLEDCRPEIVISSPELIERLQPISDSLALRLLSTSEALGREPQKLPDVDADRPAMIVYTSGTTGGPKGVVTTHANIEAQVRALVESWRWTDKDRILLVLPLHHVHGIVNVLTSALRSGAVCEMAPRFDADEVWQRFAKSPLTLFMAVPTIFSKLIAAWKRLPADRRDDLTAACGRFRLMVSGSAALPQTVLEEWRTISGHLLLERYGMTEIGMALSNPLDGERRPGHVGQPLPGVEVRRVDEDGQPVSADDEPGEIWVRGPTVFREYWERPEETKRALAPDGWFKTGDVAVVEDGSYRLLGRLDLDIIKCGGFKLSAFEIEETLRRHGAVRECAVVGVPDETWGERVGVAVELVPGQVLTLESLREWCTMRLAVYKAPSRLALVDELPRNALGKVIKPAVRELLAAAGAESR